MLIQGAELGGNLIRARSSFERLVAVSPEHPQLKAFELQIGETLKAVQGPGGTNDARHTAGAAPGTRLD